MQIRTSSCDDIKSVLCNLVFVCHARLIDDDQQVKSNRPCGRGLRRRTMRRLLMSEAPTAVVLNDQPQHDVLGL